MKTALEKLIKRAGIFKDKKIPIDILDYKKLAAAATFCASKECTALNSLYEDVRRSLNMRDEFAIKLVWRGAAPEPDLDGQVRSFIDIDDNDYALMCDPSVVHVAQEKPGEAGEDGAPKSVFDDIRVAQDIDEANKGDIKKSKPATFSLKSDHIGHSDVYNIVGTIMWDDPLNLAAVAAKNTDDPWIPTASPYLSLVEKTNKDPTKKIDDFTVGISYKATVIAASSLYVDASWITDVGHWSSSQYLLSGRFVPSRGLIPLPAYKRYEGYVPAGDSDTLQVNPLWGFAATVDYSDVAHSGSKASLLTVPQYARVGFNADGAVRIGYGGSTSSFVLTTDYKYRDELSSRPADATLWTSGLTFQPSDSSPYSFSLTYQYGKKIDTLAPIKEWDFTIGFKH